MNKNVFNIMLAVLSALLAFAIAIQGLRISSLKKELAQYKSKAEGFEIALRNSEAENSMLRNIANRSNKALEDAVNKLEEAKKRYDKRNETIDDASTDWLQCPLPDEVRTAFGDYCYSDAGNEASDNSTGAM